MPKTIAIAEDEAVIRANHAELFQHQGYQVQTDASRPEAPEQLPDPAARDIGLSEEIDACRGNGRKSPVATIEQPGPGTAPKYGSLSIHGVPARQEAGTVAPRAWAVSGQTHRRIPCD